MNVQPGDEFNHVFHEAVIAEESEDEKGKISEVFQDGYMYKDLVVRHAKVKIKK